MKPCAGADSESLGAFPADEKPGDLMMSNGAKMNVDCRRREVAALPKQ